jgi:transcriptional regulator with XRE-family HTH domain
MTETDHFRAALSALLEKMGRGAQRRISEEAGVDPIYLNGILRGHKPGSEDVRAKIASALGMKYEEMLALGRQVLTGSPTDPGIPPDILEAVKNERIQKVIRAVIEVLHGE